MLILSGLDCWSLLELHYSEQGIIKEILISVIGLLTPYILTFGIYYVSGKI